MARVAKSRVAGLVLVALSASCNDANTAIRTPITPTPVTPPAPPPPVRTPFPGPGTYAFVASPVPGRSVQPYTSGSRYVLRDNGTFTLHTSGWELPEGKVPAFAYEGRYTEADGIVTFNFDWNTTSAGATGVFSGDEMTVKYGLYMSLADFEDAVYVKGG